MIVTFNLDDFPPECLDELGIEARHPDEFIARLIDLAPAVVCAAAKRHRASLTKPPKTVDEYLVALANQRLPETVSRLREFEELI